MKNEFYIVDVFAEAPYAGNPLAVVVSDKELEEHTMQAIAAEMNFSETTFVLSKPQDNEGYAIHIYTPSREIEFAGHPLLGTAHVIRKYLAPSVQDEVKLNLMQSQVSVGFEGVEETAWFKAPPITAEKTLDADSVAYAMGINRNDIDNKLPIQVFSAGTSAILVPLTTLEALQKCKLDIDKFSALSDKGFPPLVYAFTKQTHDSSNDFSVRFFFYAHEVREDPATGNGAAFFGSYLLEHNYYPSQELSIRIEQGHEVRRPSLILVRASEENNTRDIRVGGSVVEVVVGELL